jgi:hypothetical protein
MNKNVKSTFQGSIVQGDDTGIERDISLRLGIKIRKAMVNTDGK